MSLKGKRLKNSLSYKVISRHDIKVLSREIHKIWIQGFQQTLDQREYYSQCVLKQVDLLTEWDRDYKLAAERPYLFFLLAGISTQYRNIAEKCDSLGISFVRRQGLPTTSFHSFDPTASACRYFLSSNWSENAPDNLLRRHRYLRSRRHAYMHDLTHLIMSRTFVPAHMAEYTAKDTAAFFRLQESLVDYVDLVAQQRLAWLSTPLEQSGVLYRKHIPRIEEVDFSSRKNFPLILDALIQQLVEEKAPKEIKFSPAIYSARSAATLHEAFVAQTLVGWQRKANLDKLKSKLLKSDAVYSPPSSLLGLDYVNYLRSNRSEQNRVYDYLCETFLINKS